MMLPVPPAVLLAISAPRSGCSTFSVTLPVNGVIGRFCAVSAGTCAIAMYESIVACATNTWNRSRPSSLLPAGT
jgi:hypothetical protein